MNRFLDDKSARFDQLPPGLGAGLVPEGNRLLLSVDRRPYILTTPLRAETPDFVQYFDRTIGVDFAQQMYPSGSQRQAPLWDQDAQASAQHSHARTASELRGSLIRECGWIVMVHIPAPEERGLGLDLADRGKLVPRPKAAHPEAVKAFDLIVALGLVIRREDWLDATEQTGAHDLTKHMRMGVPATEGAFVVELLQLGQPDRCPGFQQMHAGCAAGLVQMLRQADGVRVVVDGMKVLDFRSAAQMLGDDVGGENRIDVPGLGPGIVGGARAGTERVGQVVVCQNTLNGRYAGQGRDAQFLEACSDSVR